VNNLELLLEAQKRGLLPPEKQALLAEAQKRGLVNLDAIDASAVTPEKPGVAVKLGRGMMDLYQGVKQLGLMASDAFTGKDDAGAYTKQVGEEIAAYERGRSAGGDRGFDWTRLAGNILTPTLLLPGGVGANLGTRAATGAAAGAAQGGLMFTPEGGSKAGQVVAGSIGGAAVPVAIQGATNMLRSGVNKGANVVSDVVRSGVDDATLTHELRTIISREGVDWTSLTQSAKDFLKAEATKQLNTGNGLNADALTRIARAKELDPRLNLTRGQALRTPADWQTEQNLRGIQGVGDELRARFGEQGTVLSEAAERIRGSSVRPYQAGEKAVSTIQQKFAETGDEVSALYKAARETVGVQANVPLGPLQTRGIQALNEFDDVIPGPIKSRLEALGVGRMGATNPTKAFTVEEAEALDKLINKRWDAGNKPLTAALTEIKGAIRDSLSALGDEGTAAAGAFRNAKSAASARFDEFGQKIARAATDDVAPDKFVRRFVVNGDVRDVRALVKTLTTGSPEQIVRGKDALNNIRAATLTEIFEGKGALADGVLSGPKLDRALKEIGPERLRALFTPAQIRDLERLRSVSLDLTKPPPLADINYSRTSSALANLLGSIGKMPGLGMVGKAGQAELERVQRTASQRAASGATETVRRPVEAMSQQSANALATRVAPYVVLPTNALLYQGNQ
jgi:hypothetical protein